MGNILKIKNLNYKNILKDISLNLDENSFNVLIGPSGSGKSILVKCIVGLLKYEGFIYIDNKLIDSKNIYELRKNFGIMLDNSFLEDESVLYNIMYPLINLKYDLESARKEVYSIAKSLDIEDLLLLNVKDLSISKRKLVSLSRTLISKPRILIIDDSFDELDNSYRKKIINYLKGITSTVIFVTNNEEDILLSDKVIIINDGKIISHIDMKKAIEDERLFTKNNLKLPFLVELSHKLKDYNLIDDVILDTKEMVDVIWK